MKVHELMTAHARCVGPDNTLVEAAGLMRQLDVGAVPVCENERIAGMLTDRDITVRGVADGRDPNTTPVREVMSPGVIYVLADQEVEEAVHIMEQRQVRRLPVLNRSKQLVGIISLGDIAVASNPAFSGLALREVSESEQTLSHRGAKAARAPVQGRVGIPEIPGAGRRGPGNDGSRTAGDRIRRGKSSPKRARGAAQGGRKRSGSARTTGKSSAGRNGGGKTRRAKAARR